MAEVPSEKRRNPVRVNLPASGIRVFHSSHGSEFLMEASRHAYYEIIFVEWGSGHLVHESSSTLLKSGDLLVTRPGFSHRFVDDAKEPLSLVVLCLEPNAVRGFIPFAELFTRLEVVLKKHGFHFSGAGPFQESRFRDLYRSLLFAGQMAENEDAAFVPQRLWSRAAEVLILLIENMENRENLRAGKNETQPQSLLLEHCEEYLKTRFLEPVRIQDLAQLSRLSYRRFTHLFKKKTGKTVHEYLEERRIHYACDQLLRTGNIVHSALHSGFEDLSTFYRAFKKRTGLTPKKFLEEKRA